MIEESELVHEINNSELINPSFCSYMLKSKYPNHIIENLIKPCLVQGCFWHQGWVTLFKKIFFDVFLDYNVKNKF
jgi:hypothetical protein